MVVWFSGAPNYSRVLSPSPTAPSKLGTSHFDLPSQSIMPSETTHRHWKDGLPIKVNSSLSVHTANIPFHFPLSSSVVTNSPVLLLCVSFAPQLTTTNTCTPRSLILSFIFSSWVATSTLSLAFTFVKPLAFSDSTNTRSFHVARLQTQADLHHPSELDIRHLVSYPPSPTWLHLLPIHRCRKKGRP